MFKGLFKLGQKADYQPCVLVVSDSSGDLAYAASTLEANGYLVHKAEGVTPALDLLNGLEMPDVFIVDFLHPETDGTDFINKIRVRYGKSTLSPVIFLLDTPEDEAVAHALGVQEVLPKPLEAEKLLLCLNSFSARA